MTDPSIRALLEEHAARYPAMQPCDAVKLLYQRRFGCGHLVENPAGTLAYLQRELAETPQTHCPLTEPIGGRFVRVQLAAMDAADLRAETLNDVFVRSAAIRGSMEEFLSDLDALLSCVSLFSFSEDELRAYLRDYRAAGCPAVSHSERYRACYHPAYRVVCADLLGEALR